MTLTKAEVYVLCDTLRDVLEFLDQEELEEYVDGKLVDKLYTSLEILGESPE